MIFRRAAPRTNARRSIPKNEKPRRVFGAGKLIPQWRIRGVKCGLIRISQMRAQAYEIFQHPIYGNRVVKMGLSWPAFLFGPIWILITGAQSGIWLFVGFFLPAVSAHFGAWDAFGVVWPFFTLICLFRGNKWIRKTHVTRNDKRIGTILVDYWVLRLFPNLLGNKSTLDEAIKTAEKKPSDPYGFSGLFSPIKAVGSIACFNRKKGKYLLNECSGDLLNSLNLAFPHVSLKSSLVDTRKPADYQLVCLLNEYDDLSILRDNCNSLLEKKPNDSIALCVLGMYNFMICDYEIAIADFDRCIKINPVLFEAHYFKGHSCDDSGRKDAALKCFLEAAALTPSDNPDAWNCLASHFLKLRAFREAAIATNHALNLDPGHYISWENLKLAVAEKNAGEAISRLLKICLERATARQRKANRR